MKEKRRFGFLSQSREDPKASKSSYQECLTLTQSLSCASSNCSSDVGITLGVMTPKNGTNNKNNLKKNGIKDTPSDAMTPLINNTNRGVGIGNSSKSKRANDLPGIFVLINQNNWARVAQRARKYPKECKISGYIQKPSPVNASNDGSSPNDRRIHVTNSFTSLATTSSYSIAPSNDQNTSNNDNKGGQTNSTRIKCKALHQACTQLRKVHGYIRRCLIQALKETDHLNLLHYIEKNGHGEMERNICGTQSFNSISSFDSSEDGSYANGHSRVQQQPEWDDPWIEACKAILAIIEMNPSAAGQRESRHGCLPIHLAAFAMCPTPTLDSVGYTSYEPSADHNFNNRRRVVVSEELPPPRPLAPSRRLSHSSAASSVTSLDGFSTVMETEHQQDSTGKNKNDFSSNNSCHSCNSTYNSTKGPNPTSPPSRGLSETLEALEAKLRSSPDSTLSKKDEVAMLESARVLSLDSRPPPLASYVDRGASIGSVVSNCSNSVVSSASTIPPSSSPKFKSFDLKKYIANAARREEYSTRVINALLDAFPRGVKVDSEGGRLPLHTAVAGRATLKVLQTLIRANPHAARHRNNENSLPLHLAAKFGVSEVEVAPMLLRVYPDASVGKNRFERTPLEEALLMAGENGRPFQMELLQALRRPPHFWTCDFAQPVQNANFQSQGFSDIEALLKGEGHTQSQHPSDGIRTSQLMNYDIVTDLIVLVKARQWNIITDKIDCFVAQANRYLQTTVRAGYAAKVSALYIACEQEPTYEVLDALVSTCPGTTTWRKQPGGQLPIHAACTWGASSAVIGFLLAASPDSAKQRDSLGNLPLHCACFSGASEDIIESLLCTNPKAVDVRNNHGSSPRDIVRRLNHRNRKEILNLIEKVSLELLKKKRHHDTQKQTENFKSKPISGRRMKAGKKSKQENKGEKDASKGIKERAMNITRSDGSSGENIEVELAAEEVNDGMLWI